MHLILLLLLTLFSSLIVKNKNLIYLSIIFFIGIFIYYLIFLLRETVGYNIFLFPLYVIIISILLDKLEKKIYNSVFNNIYYSISIRKFLFIWYVQKYI